MEPILVPVVVVVVPVTHTHPASRTVFTSAPRVALVTKV
jgi:hypothetical protein